MTLTNSVPNTAGMDDGGADSARRHVKPATPPQGVPLDVAAEIALARRKARARLTMATGRMRRSQAAVGRASAERDRLVLELVDTGLSLAAVADLAGITRQRAHQMVTAERERRDNALLAQLAEYGA